MFIINIGSTSKKYTYFIDDKQHHQVVFHAQETDAPAYRTACATVIDQLHADGINIDMIGLRIVAPGSYFLSPQRITPAYVAALKQVAPYVPIHINAVLDEIALLHTIVPHATIYGLSDSMFHQTIPTYARAYAIDPAILQAADLYKFGYHGFSAASCVRKIQPLYNDTIPARMIIAHIGGGVSITAVHNGVSIDTSMEYTPLSGVPMHTRSGSMDIGAYVRLKNYFNYTDEEIISYLYNQAGIAAIFMNYEKKRLREWMLSDFFINPIVKTIGSYIAQMNGVDVLIFAGGIGENVSSVRTAIIDRLSVFGSLATHVIVVDEAYEIMYQLKMFT